MTATLPLPVERWTPTSWSAFDPPSRTDEELEQYRRDRNAVSIDGLPAFD